MYFFQISKPFTPSLLRNKQQMSKIFIREGTCERKWGKEAEELEPTPDLDTNQVPCEEEKDGEKICDMILIEVYNMAVGESQASQEQTALVSLPCSVTS